MIREYKLCYNLLFVAIISLTLISCNVNESDGKEESSNLNSTQYVETTNDYIDKDQIEENSSADEIEYDNDEIASEDVDEYADYDEKTIELLERAKDGDIDSMNTLAYYYFNGIDVEQDYQKSLDWSIKSAEGGNLASMFNAGYNYYYGFTGEVNYDLAFEWYQEAANEMFPKALNALGHMYYEGLGVEKDIDKAIEYTLQSAGFLHSYSLSNMGTIIEDASLDGDENYWYRLAAKNYMIKSGSNEVLYENLISEGCFIEVDYQAQLMDIPVSLITDILYKFYSGTLYDYLESASLPFKDFDVNELNIDEQTLQMISPHWWYDSIYLVDLNSDGLDEILSYNMGGSAGGISFNLLQYVDNEYVVVDDFSKYPILVGINGLIKHEDEKYFVVANVDIGNRVIYGVNIYSFDGLKLSNAVNINIDEIDVNTLITYQAGTEYNELAEIVKTGIHKIFVEKYGSLLYENINENILLDSDIDNDGDIEHYEYKSIFQGTINRPVSIEFHGQTTSDYDLFVINQVLRFSDLGMPIGIEIFTLEGVNYVGVLSYELGTNNHCLTTFRLENEKMTVIMNHLITFNERFIVK